MTFADFHCDTITSIISKKQKLYSNTGEVDIKRLTRYESPAQVFALCFDGCGSFDEATVAIDYLKSEIQENNKHINLAKSFEDILENKKKHLISALIGIEGGEVLDGDLRNVERLYDMGVRVFTLTWNLQNAIGYGVLSGNKGITDFGRRVIDRLNELGIIVDVSHLSTRGFWDVAEYSKEPFIASHSNCAAICDNVRNLSDEQIKVIAERNSVIGVNFYPMFLNSSGDADMSDIVSHMRHLEKVGGIDCIALGSDFDGMRYLPVGVDDVSFYKELYSTLLQEFGEGAADKIMSENMMRVVRDILKRG